jgi:V8-like Glu-specific endopeptidase
VIRRWSALVALGLVLACCASPGGSAPAGTAPTTAAGGPDGIGRVASAGDARLAGTLLRAGGDHFCSGTLVAGGRVDLVVTAAHCVTSGPGLAAYAELEYAPAYRHGTAPYGLWKAARVTVDPRWTEHADPDLDVAFIQLAARDGQRVGDVVTARRIAFDTPGTGPVRLVGYPDDADDPLTCLGTMSRRDDGQLRVGCTGYTAGTSGSPWLADVDPATGTRAVVGVIGGFQEGGATADVSYSPYFGADVQRLYRQAVRGGG